MADTCMQECTEYGSNTQRYCFENVCQFYFTIMPSPAPRIQITPQPSYTFQPSTSPTIQPWVLNYKDKTTTTTLGKNDIITIICICWGVTLIACGVFKFYNRKKNEEKVELVNINDTNSNI